MTALPDQLRDFDSELERAPGTFFPVFRWTHRSTIDSDYVEELQAWAEGYEPKPRWATDLPEPDPARDVAAQVDRAAGEHFRGTWRRRLADAHGDCGYVARQMRKAGVPLDLALVILLLPDDAFQAAPTPLLQTESVGWPGQGATAALPVPRSPAWPSSLRLEVAT